MTASPSPLIAAHRGGALLWAENSLTAFRNALALGVDLVELDVHLTADGALAVIHDPTLERTTDGRGAVRAAAAAALRNLRLKGPDGVLTDDRVPMLDDVLTLVRPTPTAVLLEVKSPGRPATYARGSGGLEATPGPRYESLEQRLLAALGGAGLSERTTVMAFNPAVLEHVRALAPAQRLTLLVGPWQVAGVSPVPEEIVTFAQKTGATDLGLDWRLVDERMLAAARVAGLRLGVWTVNDEPEIRRMIVLGVDVLTTDRPDLALKALGR